VGALDLIKPAVREQPPYTLAALESVRKLNQNESPYDVPEGLKREIAARVISARWQRYPEFVPASLLARLSETYGWPADGILVGNGQYLRMVKVRRPADARHRALPGIIANAVALDGEADVPKTPDRADRGRKRVRAGR